jgi:hypothetical protein
MGATRTLLKRKKQVLRFDRAQFLHQLVHAHTLDHWCHQCNKKLGTQRKCERRGRTVHEACSIIRVQISDACAHLVPPLIKKGQLRVHRRARSRRRRRARRFLLDRVRQ